MTAADLEREIYPPQLVEQAGRELQLLRGEMSSITQAAHRAHMAEVRGQERDSRIRDNLAALKRARIPFEMKGTQAIIRLQPRTFEFWPSSGKWRERDMGMQPERVAWYRRCRKKGEGVDTLLAAIRETP